MRFWASNELVVCVCVCDKTIFVYDCSVEIWYEMEAHILFI